MGRASSPSGHRMSSAEKAGLGVAFGVYKALGWPMSPCPCLPPPPEARTTDDLSKEFFGCVAKEGYAAHQELVENDAHGPPVHRLAVSLAQNDLGCDVLWGPTHLGAGRQPAPWPQEGPRGRAEPRPPGPGPRSSAGSLHPR